ncbi:MAG: type III-A CRISPR-associated protein Csm2 [Helicobacteraceae bacterium]|jgi:CRISPR-associated protein Csm2|nr:type III-A CRISPR-associated protein Csm2 [Helicobacteraceae bacterium]
MNPHNYGSKGSARQNEPKLNIPNDAPIDLKEIKADLFDTVAKKWAKAIVGTNTIGGTKPTQARNFYDYVLDLQSKVEDKKEEFANILPFVKMLNSKVHYAKERKHASGEFAEMIKRCVNQVEDEKTLKTFKLFFEAVIGFSKK